MQETSLSKTDARITNIFIDDEELSSRYGFEPDTPEKKTFFSLCSAVRQCGEAARANQSHIHRSLKSDGSILTETDLAISDALLKVIRKLYPDCNIVTEETDLKSFNDNARYTFVLDPIDGTDAYSQGLPAWCVGLGILDSRRRPCGAVINAPRFGVGTQDMFLCSMPGNDRVYLNGKQHKAPEHYDVPRQMLMGSDTLHYVDMSAFKGKVRVFGSSIIHLVSPLVFSNIDCTINTYCYAWDIASADAILEKSGMSFVYMDGSTVDYDNNLLIERNKIRMPVFSGHKECVNWMRDNLRLY